MNVQKSEKIDSDTVVVGPVSQSNKIVICRQNGCHDISTTQGFCRLHYLGSWKRLKTKEAKKKGQELQVYLTELARKFPEEFMERLKSDVEEIIEKDRVEEADDGERGIFDAMEGDEDIDTIIKGLRVEDI